MPYEASYTRRNMKDRFRCADSPKLFAWPAGNGATALPIVMSETTYTPLAETHATPLKPGGDPQLLANDIYGYRPGLEEKMLGLEFCTVTGADNTTQVWEFGMYAAPHYLTRGASPTFTGWKLIGTANFTMTIGSRSLATQTVDPFTNAISFTSATIRWADTYAETDNDFNNSTAGFYRFFPMGYGALNKSGLVIVDCSFCSLICIRLVTRPTTPSVRDFVGIYSEIN